MYEFERLFATSGLSLDRLRTFLRVAEAGNLAKAAKGDANRQSQFSRQVKELESFFGVALTPQPADVCAGFLVHRSCTHRPSRPCRCGIA